MKSPLISIVIPTYKRTWGLRRAIESVLRQSFRDFELWIVDDASPDDTADVAGSFSDPRIRYFRQPTNVGVARNWSAGLERAEGEFVALLMDDDRYEPDFLAHRVTALQANPNASFAFGGYRVLTEDGRETKIVRPAIPANAVVQGKDLLLSILGNNCFVGATAYRTADLRRVWPQAQEAGIVLDHAANVRLAIRPESSAVFIDSIDFVMAEHPEQLSQTKTDQALMTMVGVFGTLRREELPVWAGPLLNRHSAFLLVQAGRLAAARGERRQAASRFLSAVRHYPTWYGGWSQLIRLLLGRQPTPERPGSDLAGASAKDAQIRRETSCT
jgi:glycosyltransferase involved in cell wall biosynthesis